MKNVINKFIIFYSKLSALHGVAITVCITSAISLASVTIPGFFTFSPGAPISSSEINSNFEKLATLIQGQQSQTFMGTWDATNNLPDLSGTSPVSGDYYVVSVAGTFNSIPYAIGDWIIWDGTAWTKILALTNNLALTGGTLTGDLILNTQAKFKGNANYVTLKASSGLAADIILTLPTSVGTNGQVLSTNGSGVMSWTTVSSGGGVSSVNSQTGTITLTTTDIAEGTNQYFTTARALAAVTSSLTGKQNLDATLTALASYNTSGIVTQTAADTFTGRTLTGTANRLTITNGDGVAGNPTINLDTTLLPSPVAGDTGKFLKASGADTSSWTALTSSDVTTAIGFTPINKVGDTLTSGTFTYSGAAVLRTLDPIGATDVATKQYVDAAVAGAITSSSAWTSTGTHVYKVSGNVGIGTMSPTASLTVAGTASFAGTVTVGDMILEEKKGSIPYAVLLGISNTGDYGGVIFGRSNSTGAAMGSVAIGISNTIATDNGMALGISNNTSGFGAVAIGVGVTNNIANSLMIGPSDAAKMTILSSGNVGIGTTTPLTPLDVNGEIRTRGSSNGYIGFKAPSSSASTTYTWPTTDGASNYVLTTNGAGSLTWVAPFAGLTSSNVTTALGYTPINKAGDTLTGTLTFASGNFTIGQNAFLVVPNPVLPTDAVNKQYVDSFGQWTASGTDVYRTSGRVGIGILPTSTYLLEVASDILLAGVRVGKGAGSMSSNSAFGSSALGANTSGNQNTALGSFTLSNSTTGTGSTAVGAGALQGNTIGSHNIGIGYSAGSLITTGSNNVVIGSNNGSDIATSSNNIIISDGSGNPRLFINTSGNMGIGTLNPSYLLDVNGDVNIFGPNFLRIGGTQVCSISGCTAISDSNLKENIRPLENSLENILKIEGVTYDWKDKNKYGKGKQIGVIAQDLEKIYPEVVVTDKKSGLKSVAYDHLIAPLIEAFKSIYQNVTEVKRELASVKKENALMKAYLCDRDKNAPFCK